MQIELQSMAGTCCWVAAMLWSTAPKTVILGITKFINAGARWWNIVAEQLRVPCLDHMVLGLNWEIYLNVLVWFFISAFISEYKQCCMHLRISPLCPYMFTCCRKFYGMWPEPCAGCLVEIVWFLSFILSFNVSKTDYCYNIFKYYLKQLYWHLKA